MKLQALSLIQMYFVGTTKMYVLVLLISICIVFIFSAVLLAIKHSPLRNGTQTCNMLVFTIIYMSALISVKCYKTKKNNTVYNRALLEGNLYKSLQQLNHFLAAIEKNIQHERQILRKTDHTDLHNGEAENRRGLMDYGAHVNWWNIRPPNILRHEKNYDFNTNTDPSNYMFEDVAPNMKQVIGQWIQNGNPKLPKHNLKTTIKPMVYENVSKKGVFEEFHPFLRQAVDTWIQNLASATPPNVSEVIVSSIMPGPMTTVPTTTALISTGFTSSVSGDPGTPEDPFDIDFEYGGSKVGGDSKGSTTPMQTTPEPGGVTLSPYVKSLKDQMVQRNVGYFTVYATEFFDAVVDMPSVPLDDLALEIKEHFFQLDSKHMLDVLGEPWLSNLLFVSDAVLTFPASTKRRYASEILFKLVNLQGAMDTNIRVVLAAADDLLEKDEGEQLFRTVEYLRIFAREHPNVNRTAQELAEEMTNALLTPLKRSAGTNKHRVLLKSLSEILSDRYDRRRLGNFTDFSSVIVKSQFLKKSTASILVHSHYPQYNRRTTKHEKSKHHRRNKNHNRQDHKKTRQIDHEVGKSKKQHPATRAHIRRATLGKSANILLDTTTNKINVVKKKHHRHKVKIDKLNNPISSNLSIFRTNYRTSVNIKSTNPHKQKNIQSFLALTTAGKEKMRKIMQASSYSDEENYLKVKLYRAFDRIQSN